MILYALGIFGGCVLALALSFLFFERQLNRVLYWIADKLGLAR